MYKDNRVIVLLATSVTLMLIFGFLYIYEVTKLEEPKYCTLVIDAGYEEATVYFSNMEYVKGDANIKPLFRNDELGVQLWFDDILPGVEDGTILNNVEFRSDARGVTCSNGNPEFFYMGYVLSYR